MKMKKVTAMGMAALMAATMIPSVPVMADGGGKVYYLNFKPEADEAWQNLAKAYTEETGTDVTVVTAASGQYETTLQSEMAKSDAPTLVQVNGPVGLKNWKDYCYDLKDADITKELTSDAYELKDGDAVDGIAYVIESYGLITNKTLLEKAGYTLDDIKSFDDLKKALEIRLDYFYENGCMITDHSLERVVFYNYTCEEINKIFIKALNDEDITNEEASKYSIALLISLGKMYSSRKMIMQLHIGALRNNNTRMFNRVGADAGFDSIDDGEIAYSLSRILDELDKENKLPKTILYCLNPKDNEVIGTMIGNFQGGNIAGKIQFGSGWWFNDQKDGMERQMMALSQLGLISQFVGMVTDSRSFLSYTRHEYFRRILCNYLGYLVESGQYPYDQEILGEIVENICYKNSAQYFKR